MKVRTEDKKVILTFEEYEVEILDKKTLEGIIQNMLGLNISTHFDNYRFVSRKFTERMYHPNAELIYDLSEIETEYPVRYGIISTGFIEIPDAIEIQKAYSEMADKLPVRAHGHHLAINISDKRYLIYPDFTDEGIVVQKDIRYISESENPDIVDTYFQFWRYIRRMDRENTNLNDDFEFSVTPTEGGQYIVRTKQYYDDEKTHYIITETIDNANGKCGACVLLLEPVEEKNNEERIS